VFLMSQKN